MFRRLRLGRVRFWQRSGSSRSCSCFQTLEFDACPLIAKAFADIVSRWHGHIRARGGTRFAVDGAVLKVVVRVGPAGIDLGGQLGRARRLVPCGQPGDRWLAWRFGFEHVDLRFRRVRHIDITGRRVRGDAAARRMFSGQREALYERTTRVERRHTVQCCREDVSPLTRSLAMAHV